MNTHKPREQDPGELPPAPRGLADLARPQAPGRDLWPGIEARLRAGSATRPRRVGPAWMPWAAAASLALAIGGGVLMETQNQQTRSRTGAPPPAVASLGPALPAWQPSAAGNLQKVSLRRPENRALVKANLKMVNSAQSELQRALQADPESAYLKRLLQTTEHQSQDLNHLLDQAD